MALVNIYKYVPFRVPTVAIKSTFSFSSNRFTFRNYCKVAWKMNTAYFQNKEGDDNLDVYIQYTNDVLNVNKTLSFGRRMSENIDKFLVRLNVRVDDIVNKKIKKKAWKSSTISNENSNQVNAYLELNGERVPNETIFAELLNRGDTEKLKLIIENVEYNVQFNLPVVSKIELPKELKLGCPVSPEIFEAVCTDETLCEFTWFKNVNKCWVECGKGYSYVPKQEDINCYLKLTCVPKNNTKTGPKVEAYSESQVIDFVHADEIAKRHETTKTETERDEIRVVTYNILANLYTNTKEAKTSLFTYCRPEILDISYRTQLIYKELLGYNADLICLQEVEKKFFLLHLKPFLSNLGFFGFFNEKEGTREGCASFYKLNKFKVLELTTHTYSVELVENPVFNDLKEKIIGNEQLMKRLEGLSTQLQLIVFDWTTTASELIVLGNTHLYFHPDADHIRLLQGIMAFRLLLESAKEQQKKNPDKNVSILFCGDLNSTPDCGIYQFMTKGSVDCRAKDWESKLEEKIEGVSFSHSLNMTSACGAPKFTNYTEGFKACLDYIYFQSDRLHLKSFVPLPEEEVLSREVAIPSSYFPSDHVALVADLKLKV